MALLNLDAATGKFAEKLGLTLEVVLRKLAIDLHTAITKRTPVDTGRARASWNIAQGEPLLDVPPPNEGEAPLPSPGVPTFVVDGTAPIYITSSLVYIEALENGHSSQAPAGMVAVSLAEAEAIIEAILRNLPTT